MTARARLGAAARGTPRVPPLQTIPNPPDLDDVAPQFNFGTVSLGGSAAARFLAWDIAQAVSTTDIFRFTATRSGLLARFWLQQQVAGTADATNTYTVLVDGIATTLVIVVGNSDTSTVFDLVNSVAVAAGQKVSLRCTKSGAAATGAASVTAGIGFLAPP